MRIAINTRLLIKNKLEGIGWFTYETLKRITASHPEHHFIFLFDRNPHPDFIFGSNVEAVVLPPQARHPILWYIWFEVSVFRFLRKNRIDLFVSPDGYISLRTKTPTMVVMHDINFFHYPEGVPAITRLYYNYFFPRFARKAYKVVTVSNYSKDDIVQNFGIEPNKISVTYNGANTAFTPLVNDEITSTRDSLTQGKPYFVFVGALSPRKNVARLIKAFQQFQTISKLDYRLVIVGEPMFMTADIKEALNNIENKESVVFTGRLQIDRLRLVVGSAVALTYVPYFEGFGIPIVEAMRCHIPIIASNRTSIPEVAGNAAIYVDPFDIESMANAMKLVAIDPKLRDALAAKSAERAQEFSWDKTAEELYSAMEEQLNLINKE
ncbi:MAG: glycosyltransferase family 1 protein [Tenuifilaceae bacterium]|jgi:glycosyltransferase involved in cell wall biosynthesis|nr:glycosyltransferase family 1 protein [Tenuifilaceae bacterium]